MIKCFKLLSLSIFFGSFILSSQAVLAADENIEPPALHVNIGSFAGWGAGGGIYKGSEYCPSGSGKETECIQVSWLSDYIVAIYKYGVVLAAVLATIMIMVGGLFWLMSGGSPDRIGKAKTFIGNSLLGLMLALFSYMILYTVNPALVNVSPLRLSKPKEVVFTPYVRYGAESQARDDLERLSDELGVDLGEGSQVTDNGVAVTLNSHAFFGAMSEAMLGEETTDLLNLVSTLGGYDINPIEDQYDLWSVDVSDPNNSAALLAWLEEQRQNGTLFYSDDLPGGGSLYAHVYDDGSGVWFLPQQDGSITVQNSLDADSAMAVSPSLFQGAYYWFTGRWWN